MTLSQTLQSATFIKISAFYFFYFGNVGVYIIYLPDLLKSFGYLEKDIGILFSIPPIMRFLMPFVFIKHIKLTKNVFAISIVSSWICGLLFFLNAKNIILAGIFLALLGGFWSTVLPFIEVLALEKIGKHYGKARLFGSVGFILIGLILGHIYLDFNVATIAYLLTLFITVILGFLLKKDLHDINKKIVTNKWSFLNKDNYFWIMCFFMQLSFGGLYSFFTIYEKSHGVSLSIISWLWTFGVFAEILMFIFQNKFFNLNMLSIIKFCVFITSFRWYIVYLFPEDLFILFLSQSIHAFSLALFHSAAISYLNKKYENKQLAQQFYLGIGYGLGGFLGSLISGILYGENLFLWMSIFAAIGFISISLMPQKINNTI